VTQSRKTTLLLGLLALVLLGLLAVPLARWWSGSRAHGPVLLLQPAILSGESRATIDGWNDALSEEGFQARPYDPARIEREGLPGRPRAVLLPDSAVVALSDVAVAALTRYVQDGGRLLVCYDAGTRRAEDGRYSPLRSRLSGLTGVSYAMYAQRREAMFQRDVALLTAAGARALAVQPGKAEATPHGLELQTYGYDHLLYPQFATEGAVDGELLAHSPGGAALIVRHRQGSGEVLFVNLPMGYMKTRSDGYLLHQSLRLFLGEMAGAAQLLPVPGGIGGMVMNIHVDSGASIAPLKALEAGGLLQHGPFSMQFTAGPDTYRPGDHTGLDVDHNEWAQAFIRRMAALGHEIGSHGGWIHNEFGLQANEDNRERFEPYLELNHASITRALGHPPASYSAPVGNQPLWSSLWLAKHGIVAHYDTGGGGLGPTRPWRDGKRVAADLWALPVANFRTVATFEEIEGQRLSPADEARGIAEHRDSVLAMMDYAADQRVARLTYFHAPAAARHLEVVRAWEDHAAKLEAARRFRWYRMEDLARFMSRREQSEWSWDGQTLRASHPESLVGFTWRLPDAAAAQVRLERGTATWRSDGTALLVEVQAGRELQLSLH
jgi:hypothetical protein